jgi:hypothetical protein
MKRSTIFSLVLVITVSVLVWSNGYAQTQQVSWDVFGKNLVKAIKTGNEGLQQSAMQLIIRHADNLNVKDAAFDIVRIFRDQKDPKVRQLAMVTLYHLKHGRAMYFLQRNIRFEKDEAVRKLNTALVKAYYADKKPSGSEKETVITISAR